MSGPRMITTNQHALTRRWTLLDYHPVQYSFFRSPFRFNVVPSGRRSGKTDVSLRRGVLKAMITDRPDYWGIFAAPTHKQAKRIFWNNLKGMIPREFLRRRPLEADLTLELVNGADLTVLGLDAPDRVEGRALDHAVVDEIASMKEKVWQNNLRPALSTRGRPGTADLIGKPIGRGHYYQKWKRAISDDTGEWAGWHWVSADILPAEEIESARRELDPLVFAQEYEGSFVSFEGKAYYQFDFTKHAVEKLPYFPEEDLVFAFDFNVKPGVAAILQEQRYVGGQPKVAADITAAIGEVWIPENSNTVKICRRLIQDWGNHKGRVLLYGDATGGAKGTAKVKGSDWDLIKNELYAHFGSERVSMRVPRKNPFERLRVNAVNSRLQSTDGTIRFLIDPKCEHIIEDFDGVMTDEDGSGDIDKNLDKTLTHISDAVGYYIYRKHKISGKLTIPQTYEPELV